MSLFGMFQISASALTAERLRAEVATSNLANAETTRTPEGGPYRRRMVLFHSQPATPFHLLLASSVAGGGARQASGGVAVNQVVDDPTPPTARYEPGHPDADANGFVTFPNVNPISEIVNLLSASRAFEANATAVETLKAMASRGLDITK